MQLLGAEQEVLQIARNMPAPAVDDPLVVAAADVLHHRFFEIELHAFLVVVGDLEPATAVYPPVLDRDFPQQRLDQRALAHAVRTDQSDAIAAHDAPGEVANDGVAAELDAKMLGL